MNIQLLVEVERRKHRFHFQEKQASIFPGSQSLLDKKKLVHAEEFERCNKVFIIVTEIQNWSKRRSIYFYPKSMLAFPSQNSSLPHKTNF